MYNRTPNPTIVITLYQKILKITSKFIRIECSGVNFHSSQCHVLLFLILFWPVRKVSWPRSIETTVSCISINTIDVRSTNSYEPRNNIQSIPNDANRINELKKSKLKKKKKIIENLQSETLWCNENNCTFPMRSAVGSNWMKFVTFSNWVDIKRSHQMQLIHQLNWQKQKIKFHGEVMSKQHMAGCWCLYCWV